MIKNSATLNKDIDCFSKDTKFSTRHLVFFFSLLFVLFSFLPSAACTSLIVSGRATKDGRPMIMKHRDSGCFSNMMILVQGERYKYLALVNARDMKPHEVWSGHNEKGFAIINTADYNLNKKDEKEEREGILMRKALANCATLKDFETMLDTLKHPLCVNTNFGVLDAQGGCAYYETGNNGYVKFDANDPKVAPHGYLVRTNFAFSGDRTKDQGVERFAAISELMEDAFKNGDINCQYLITHVPRDLKHGLTKVNLNDLMPDSQEQTTFVPFCDFIPRYISVSDLLVQGVLPKENPLQTISWTNVGYPLTSVAIPLMITPSGKLPQVVTPGKNDSSELATMALKLKKRIFPLKRGHYEDYMDLSKLLNKQGTGILQRILPIEKEILTRGEDVIDKIRSKGKFSKDIDKYYDWVDQYVRTQYAEF